MSISSVFETMLLVGLFTAMLYLAESIWARFSFWLEGHPLAERPPPEPNISVQKDLRSERCATEATPKSRALPWETLETRDSTRTALHEEPAVQNKKPTAKKAAFGPGGLDFLDTEEKWYQWHTLRGAPAPPWNRWGFRPRGWPAMPPASSRPALVPVADVESAPAAPTNDVTSARVVAPSPTLAVLVPVVAPVVVLVTPVIASQVPVSVPAVGTAPALVVPAVLPAPAAASPVPTVVAFATVPVATPPVDGLLPALPYHQSLSLGVRALQGPGDAWGLAASTALRLAPPLQGGSGLADIMSGWCAADAALTADLDLLTAGVSCLSLGQEDSDGDQFMVGTTVLSADGEVGSGVQVGPKMDWESSPDPTAGLAMDIDVSGSSGSGAGGGKAMDCMPGNKVTDSPSVGMTAPAPTPAAPVMVVNVAAVNTVAIPRAAFAAGRVAVGNEGRALYVSALPGVGIGNGGAMLLAYTAPAYVAPQQTSVCQVAVITAGIRNLVLGGAIAPMVSAPRPSVQDDGGAMLQILTGLAALSLDGPSVAAPTSTYAGCVTYFVGNGPPGTTGSTSVVNQDSVGGPSTLVLPHPVVATMVLPGSPSASTPVAALSIVAAAAPSATSSPKRKSYEQLRAPVPSGFHLARQGAFAPTAEKRRPFRPPPGLAGMHSLAATSGPPALPGVLQLTLRRVSPWRQRVHSGSPFSHTAGRGGN